MNEDRRPRVAERNGRGGSDSGGGPGDEGGPSPEGPESAGVFGHGGTASWDGNSVGMCWKVWCGPKN